ncbi:SRPBCC domain-containing protein [Croceicoccus sp. F390]|uniref:SRPBCC domain-containing protein n=1 Tax=Croceicoccus esteveae TaxID=3075597 RepID=A0ABU2ZG86_9SPHN|nr:SRPBCC domain-containing protein [Croceicoccus sp. F390]MDT0575371.1 SRPBCC domain-containing protein [Croceicoccus sp. F390]
MKTQLPDYDPQFTVRSKTVEIDAPASIVWDILVDMDRYGEWNPFCFEASSTLEMGAPVHMQLNSYIVPGETQPNCEYICAYEPERLLSWELPESEDMPYPARRDQVIEPVRADKCRYFSTDAFFGPNARHVMLFAGPWVKRAFDDTADALKARAEAFAAQNGQG